MNIQQHTNNIATQLNNSYKEGSTLWKGLTNEQEKDQPLNMAEKLANAIAEHTERTLRGPGGLTEEEIQEKLKEFINEFKPENGTEEELKSFFEQLKQFEQSLREHNEKIAREFLRMRSNNIMYINNASRGVKEKV